MSRCASSETPTLTRPLFTAPAGQPYWFNPSTNVSTYVRPQPVPGFPPAPPHLAPPIHYQPGAPPAAAAAPAAKEKKEKPKTKTPIEGTDWTRVLTNKGNTFWTNRVTKESVWTLPDELKELAAKDGSGKKRKAGDDGPAADDAPEPLEVEVEGDDPELLTVSDAAPAPAPEVKVEPVEEPKKKRKRQNKVVREIEEMEQDEDWQRQIASQMAAEAAADDPPVEPEAGGEQPNAEQTPEGSNSASKAPTPVAPAPTPAAPTPAEIRLNEVSREEAAAMFKV